MKFEHESFRQDAGPTAGGGRAGGGPLPGTSGKHPLAEEIGTAITGGAANAGTRGYLMVRSAAGCPSPAAAPSAEQGRAGQS